MKLGSSTGRGNWQTPKGRLIVRYWHKADMLNALTNVRFWEQSGHGPTAAYQTRFMSTRPSLIEGQRLGDLSIAHIGVAVDIGKSLPIRVHYLEAAV